MKIMEKKNIYLGISIVLIVISLLSLGIKNFNYGIDFTGGNILQLKFEKNIDMESLDKVLEEIEIGYPVLSSRKVQISEGNVGIIRTPEINELEKGNILAELEKKYLKFEIQKSDKIGSTIGKELKWKAINALLIASLLIVGYITIRFEFKFALAAIIALFHDVIITLGVISLMGSEINSPFIAAVLTILGYSINDTIVVFDRIRENLKKNPSKSLGDIIDNSITQVFRRSINTSVTTLLAISAVLIFGGASIRTFITALLIGVLAGTYSSIFVASPVVDMLEKGEKVTLK